MKKSDLNKMLGLIDEDILKEAMPSGKKKTQKTALWLKIVSMAACFLLILNATLVPTALFMGNKISSLVNELEGKNQLLDGILNGGTAGSDTVVEGAPIYNQNVLEITVGKNNDKTVMLSSPLLSAPSKYNDIINSMIGVNGSLTPPSGSQDKVDQDASENESTKNEIEDLENKLEDAGDKYHETTDLQVKDVIEGDIIKRSSKYIYYLSGSKLKIYSINKQNSEIVGLFSLDKYIEALNEVLKIPEQLTGNSEAVDKEEIYDELEEAYGYNAVKEMFLSTDLKTVTVIIESRIVVESNHWDRYIDEDCYNDALYCTTLLSLNVEDPTDVYLNNLTTVFGAYESARLVGDSYLVFTRYAPLANELIIPQYNDGEGFKYIERENIYSPSEYKNSNYLISYKINKGSYDVSDAHAYASFDGEVYVTSKSIYVTRQYVDKTKLVSEYPVYVKDVHGNYREDAEAIIGYGTKTTEYRATKTDILKIDTSSGKFVPVGAISLDGTIKDRYSLSENGEYFYAVTTDEEKYIYTYYKNNFGAKTPTRDYSLDSGTSANLYVIDSETMALVSSVMRFAPEGETVRSVRFDGYNAYVCTAVKITDPVFFFNLSDPYNIVYSDTGTIPGFSTSLIELKNGQLLGIGTDGSYLKLEIYEKGENNTVNIVDTIKFKSTSYASDYKSYFIDRENGYIGIGYRDWTRESKEQDRYALVKIENGTFVLVFDMSFGGTLNSKRAVLIDGYFYMLSSKEFEVLKIS